MKRKMRTIDKLRKLYPHLSWRYEKNWYTMPYPPTQWYNNEGWGVTAYSAASRCCMDPCDHYRTEYRRSDTNEEIHLDYIGGDFITTPVHGPIYKTLEEILCSIPSP